ncbi:MAG: hypothetical protein V4667_11915 [Bacteroidota bacterium]
MSDQPTKEKIFSKLKRAFFNSSDATEPKFSEPVEPEEDCTNDSTEVTFAKNFTKRGGKFVFCIDKDEFAELFRTLIVDKGWIKIHCMEENLKTFLSEQGVAYVENVDFTHESVTFTTCEFLGAKDGCAIFSSNQAVNTRMTNTTTTHVVMAYTSQVIDNTREAYRKIISKYFNQTPPTVYTYKGKPLDSEDSITMQNQASTEKKEIYLFLIDDTEQ